MFELFLNGKTAIIKKDSSFKLTRENPFLKDVGDYTLDVVLPLSINENRLIFGLASRLDVNKRTILDTRYDFKLRADNLRLEGSATVTEINNEEIKVQLLAGAEDLAIKSKNQDGSDIYVDELDLGQAYKELYIRETGSEDGFNMKSLISLFVNKKTDTFDPESYMYGLHTQTDCVCFPIYSNADSDWSNKRNVSVFRNESKAGKDYSVYFQWALSTSNQTEPGNGGCVIQDNLVLAPQPYFYIIIDKIFNALGYTVIRNDIESSWMADIFIANSRALLNFSDILPHWTVYEFIDEVQNFFGVRFLINGKSVSIVFKKYLFDLESPTALNDILDDFTISCDSDAQLDTSLANVDYDMDFDAILKLPDEVYQKVEVKTFNDSTEAKNYYDSLTEEEKSLSNFLLEDKSNNITYASLSLYGSFNFHQVDMMSALYRRESRDIDIKLRIVPCKIKNSESQFDIFNKYYYETVYYHLSSGTIEFLALYTDDSRNEKGYNSFSVNDAILNNSENQDKQNVIEVAINQGRTEMITTRSGFEPENKVLYAPYAHGVPYVKLYNNDYVFKGSNHFRLKYDGEGITRDALSSSYSFDSRGKICISFIDDGDFTPEGIYLIGGKRYVCEKLEFTINADGVDKIKKGYFYPIL